MKGTRSAAGDAGQAERTPDTPSSARAERSSAAFEPIEQLRAHEYVAEQLRRQIGLHLIAVGEALPSERDLAVMFGVGRATVQAAVRLLEAEKLVETRRGRSGGTFVIGHARGEVSDGLARDYLLVRLRRDRQRILEALVFRGNVDTFAARLAATERTAEDLEKIRGAHVRAATATTDVEFMAHDTEFHLSIAAAAHNSFVYGAVEHIRLVLNDAITALPESELWQRRTAKEHAAVLRAIERADGPGAAREMGKHADWTQRSTTALLAAL